VRRFKEVGKRLLDAHVLFDVLPDDRVTRTAKSRYEAVIDPSDLRLTATNVMNRLPSGLSRLEAPAAVRISVSRPATGNELTMHFVNYNREEPADKKKRGQGIKDEKPIVASSSEADFRLPPGYKAHRVEFLTPENEQAQVVEFKQTGRRLRFRVPEFLVYGIMRIQ
jgi:hypothetical protein